ncbi:MAG: oligosaccharide flippase family protein [Candidatus Binataceae bacterium]
MSISGIWRGSRGSLLGADALLTLVTNLALGTFGVFTGVFVARLLGPHARGELAAIQTWPSFVGTLAMIGMGEAVVYYSAREPDQAGRYLASGLILAGSASIPFAGLAYIVMPRLLSAQSPAVVTAARWYLAVVPIYAFIGMQFQPLRGRRDFTAWNALRLTPSAVWICVLVTAWFLERRTPSFIAGANLAGLAILVFPVAAVVNSRVPGPFIADPALWGPMLRYGLPCVGTSLPQLMNLRLDQMLMAAFLAPKELGLYVVAVAWSSAIGPLLNAIGAVLLPRVAASRDQSRSATFATGARLGTVSSVAASLILLLLTPWGIVLLFGESFRAALPAALVLVIAGAAVGFNSVVEDGFRGLGQPATVMYAEICGLIATGISLAVLLRPMRILGAAVASLLGYSTVTVVLLIFAKRKAGIRPTELLVPDSREISAGIRRVRLLWLDLMAVPGRV